MTTWLRLLLGLLSLAPAGVASAQTPAAGLSATQLDIAVADTLKEVHNRGAELYNRGDHGGAYRLYEGALSSVRPFVAHRPAVLKAIDDGLSETAKSDGPKVQAFRLHEIIEQVRADLKAEVAKAAEAKPATPEVPAKPAPPVTPSKRADPPKAAEKFAPHLEGTLTYQGKPLAADVTIVSLDQKVPRVFTATATDTGKFEFAAAPPAGQYAVMITGKGVPAKYNTVSTSPLRTVVAAQPSLLDLNLE